MTEETVKSKEPSRAQRSRQTREEPRPQRKTLADQEDRLEVGKQDPNYHYTWAFDVDLTGQRLYELQERGYEFALAKDHFVATAHTFDTSEYGSIIRKADGSKTNGYLYLMRISREFYEEDKAFKQKRADAQIEGIYDTPTEKKADEDEDDIYLKKAQVSL